VEYKQACRDDIDEFVEHRMEFVTAIRKINAISGLTWNPKLDRDEFFDALACRKKAREIAAKSLEKQITLCGKCIEVCPYTRKYTTFDRV